MEKNLTNQHIYIIGNQDIGEKEMFFNMGNDLEHLKFYKRIIEVYPELIERYSLIIQRNLPEQFAQHGMIIYENAGEISEQYRCIYENLEYNGLLYLPKEPTTVQKELLESRMNEFEKIFLELAICSPNKIEYISNENNEYVAYQKLKSIIHK